MLAVLAGRQDVEVGPSVGALERAALGDDVVRTGAAISGFIGRNQMGLTVPGEWHRAGAGDADHVPLRSARSVDDPELGIRGRPLGDWCRRTGHADDEPGAVA